MESRTTGSETTSYVYDVFGNLTSVTMPDKTISYLVDGHDRRVAKLVDSTVVTRYIWQSQYRLAAELNPDGTMKKQFVYADGVNSPEYMIYQGKRYMFVKDHRGSVNLVVDVDTGTIEQRIEYSEFGEVLSDTNPGFQPFGFAGGLYDPDTKLVRFGARDYDGKLGRWLAKDPIRFNGGDENLYGYVLNDPVNLIDPFGLFDMDDAKEAWKNAKKAYDDAIKRGKDAWRKNIDRIKKYWGDQWKKAKDLLDKFKNNENQDSNSNGTMTCG